MTLFLSGNENRTPTFSSNCWAPVNVYLIAIVRETFAVFNLTFRPLNTNVAADGHSYFHFKYPAVLLNGTAFSLSSINHHIQWDVCDPFGQCRFIVIPKTVTLSHLNFAFVTTAMPRDVIKGTRCTRAISLLETHPCAIGQVALSYIRAVNGHSTFALTHFNYSRVLKHARSIMLAKGTSSCRDKFDRALHEES